MRHSICRLLAVGVLCLAAVLPAAAQSNEIALTVGGYFTRHVHVKNDQMFAIQGSLARRIFQTPKVSLFVELSIAASLDNRAKGLLILGGQVFGTRHYSALFISPGLRVKLVPDSRLSPYFAIGGGLAHFSKTGLSPHSNTNVIDFGVGVDCKMSRLLALRGEVRDFYSGAPQLITGLLDREHQILATGGIVLRF